MKKRFLCLLLCATGILGSKSFSQNIAINEDGSEANPHAILDIKSFNKGILIPRVSTSGRLAIPNTKGLLVFDSTAGSFFYNTGTGWLNMVSGSTGWSLTGNGGTNPTSQFIGTTDNQPLRFRVNNIQAGQLNPATGNISWGLRAGQNNTGGYSNIAIGTDALKSNTSKSNLVAIGDSALFNNTNAGAAGSFDASFNTAVGSKSLFSNTLGFMNTAIGYQSLFSNITGYHNTAVGHHALLSNSADNNTAIGASALFANSNGYLNTAIGSFALWKNTSGMRNTAVGEEALLVNTYGEYNTVVGAEALALTTGSSYNTAVGYNASRNYEVGWNNTFVGAWSGVTQNNLYNCVAIGNDAVCNTSNQARIGNSSTTSIGGYANWTNISDGRFKKDIKEDVKGIDFIMKLRPVTYLLDIAGLSQKLNEGKGREKDEVSKKAIAEKEKTVFTGFVAQEVEKAARDAGYNFSGVDIPKGENEFYGLRYSEFVVPLVKAVQEQQRIIADLQKQVAELKQQMQHSK